MLTYNEYLSENSKFEDSLGKFHAYIQKYNINSIEDLISDLTNVVRSMNKYVKINRERKKRNFINTKMHFLD